MLDSVTMFDAIYLKEKEKQFGWALSMRLSNTPSVRNRWPLASQTFLNMHVLLVNYCSSCHVFHNDNNGTSHTHHSIQPELDTIIKVKEKSQLFNPELCEKFNFQPRTMAKVDLSTLNSKQYKIQS